MSGDETIRETESVTLDIITDDSGMYGAYTCSNCSWSTKSHEEALVLENCPGCERIISGTTVIGYPFGGSDF